MSERSAKFGKGRGSKIDTWTIQSLRDFLINHSVWKTSIAMELQTICSISLLELLIVQLCAVVFTDNYRLFLCAEVLYYA